MSTRSPFRAGAAIVAATVLVAVGTVTRAQTALTPFAVTDRAARNLILAEMRANGSTSENRDIVGVIWRAYDKMPAAARGPATTAIVAWAKAFASTPEFKTAYATERNTRKPEGAGDRAPLSVDDEVKQTVANQLAALEESKAMFAGLPAADRAKALTTLSAEDARIKSRENAQAIRVVIESSRTETTGANASASAEWAANYPADPQQWVKRYLESFLAATAGLDFALPSSIVKAPNGETLGFLRPGYTEMPWQKIHAILIGRDAVTAARAAADSWLNEIGR